MHISFTFSYDVLGATGSFQFIICRLIRIASLLYSHGCGWTQTNKLYFAQPKNSTPTPTVEARVDVWCSQCNGFALSKQLVEQRHHSCRQKFLYMTWLGPRSWYFHSINLIHLFLFFLSSDVFEGPCFDVYWIYQCTWGVEIVWGCSVSIRFCLFNWFT